MIRSLITVILSSFLYPNFAQIGFKSENISFETLQIVDELIKENVVMSSGVGIELEQPKQYDNFLVLKSKATSNELLVLTNHPVPTVRCYAFWALAYNFNINLFPIVVNHISDTSFVETLDGCIGGKERVGDFFINVVTPKHIDLETKKLDSIQFATLDSILIYTSNDLAAKAKALNNALPLDKLYLRIRQLVIQESNEDALVTLAKYKKEQDVDLILNFHENNINDQAYFFTFRAIKYFPHPKFLSLIEMNLKNQNDLNVLYYALASYKNKKALDLFQIPFSKKLDSYQREKYIDKFFLAIDEYQDTIYDVLYWKLWEEENRLSSKIFSYLLHKNKEKAILLTQKSLIDANKLYSSNMGISYLDYDGTPILINSMLDLIIETDREIALEILTNNIKSAYVHHFYVFSEKAGSLKDSKLIEPLISRLKDEDNVHICIKIVEALLDYNDDLINKKVVQLRKKYKKLRNGWQGIAIEKALKSKNIDF